MQVGPYPL
jgi:uncharacterized protein